MRTTDVILLTLLALALAEILRNIICGVREYRYEKDLARRVAARRALAAISDDGLPY